MGGAMVPCLAMGTGCGVESCSFSDFVETSTIQGPGSAAYHVTVPDGSVDSAGGGYGGQLTNLSSEMDEVVALYRFVEPPAPGAELPGAGMTMGERALPRQGERRFSMPIEVDGHWVQIGESEFGDRALDEWFVIEVRGSSAVELELDATVVVCRQGNSSPGEDVVTWEQVW